jgi:hypothetical protein
MSLTVTVIRDLGDNPGDDLTCSYFSSEQVFRQAGRVLIDQSAKGFKIVAITLMGIRKPVRVGRIIKIIDGGIEYRAKVKSIQYSHGRQADGSPYATCSMGLRMMEVA